MTITRIDVEKILVKRAGKRMTFVEMTNVTDGTNDDLAGPIVQALLVMGYTPSSMVEPTDADLVLLSDDINEFLDRAELRLLENILGNMDAVTVNIDGRSESYGQITLSLEAAITRLKAKVEKEYSASQTLSGGLIAMNFAAKEDDEPVS